MADNQASSFKGIPSKTPSTPRQKEPTQAKAALHSTPIVKKLSSDPTTKKLLTHVRMDPALKAELEKGKLLDVPNLVEHLFPDTSLPIPSSVLAADLKRRLYNNNAKAWRDFPDLSTHSSSGKEEKALADFLNNFGKELANVCAVKKKGLPSRRQWHSEQCNVPLPGGPGAKRKPDLVLADDTIDLVTWLNIMVGLELKSGSSSKDVGAALVQLINGAYMVFSSQDGRRFHIGVSFCLYDVRVYVFDRAGVVGSVGINIHTNPDTFIRLMAGLMLADLSKIGYDPTIIRTPDGRRYITVDNKMYEITETVFISDSIRGRGTVCWRVRRDGVEYVIKDSWADMSRVYTEADILKRAQGIEGVSQIVAEEIVKVDGEDDTTARIRAIINAKKYKKADWLKQLEVRAHRRIVTTPFAIGLAHFSTKKELISVFIDAIRAHHRLVEKKILHRDISLHNVMMYQPTPSKDMQSEHCEDRADDGIRKDEQKDEPTSRKGLIIDLDYATLMIDETREVATGHRTGTMPFISVGVLMGNKHEPRHDLESFFYVLLWICWHYAGPHNVERQNFDISLTPANTWLVGEDFQAIGFNKIAQMSVTKDWFRTGLLSKFAPYFEDLKDCVAKLREKIFGNYAADITHQEIIDILEETRQRLPDKEDWSWENDKEGYGEEPEGGKKRKLNTIEEEGEEEQEEQVPPSPLSKRARTSITELVTRRQTRGQTRARVHHSERVQSPSPFS
ncbi:hypothetical protein GALMADRAFT_268015 [Galerina marginata CBS 339.88]|uniref:Fungal-type protein kinase domain-containing protein n=1 Tax=Galerina marginata (strain CBS 339.88) TaxID=685588 RepID=A0A067SZL0_GALM3|nr:hypothetical protein GALMADRAFT_268015 [Galerina marginata CBS 339.88]